MLEISTVFTQNIIPIFLVAGVGFLLRKRTSMQKTTVSRLAFYAFSPCLLFSLLVNSSLASSTLLQIAGFAASTILLMGGVGYLIGRLLQFNRQERLVVALSAMFANVGSFGISFNRLRYGDEGAAVAGVYMVVSAMLVYSVGAMLASMGRRTVRESLAKLAQLPVIYAIVAAITVFTFDIQLPQPLVSAITIAGEGAIPVMLVVLGMQLADIPRLRPDKLLLTAVGTRLIFGAIIGSTLAALYSLSGIPRAAGIIEASTPVAVALIIITTEFDLLPDRVASIVALSTIVSPLTLVAVIQILGI